MPALLPPEAGAVKLRELITALDIVPMRTVVLVTESYARTGGPM